MNITAHLDTRELNLLLSRLAKIKAEVKPREVRKVLAQGIAPVVNAIKAAAPQDTGALKRSIGIIPYLGSTSGKVYVGVKKDRAKKTIVAFYASFLEFGTKFISKGEHSFFERSALPALNQSKEILIAKFQALLKKYNG